MDCYQCGCRLSEKDFCTSCGTDVGQYKKVMFLSNRFYNEGLEKAEIRDLSGAISCLRQSLKFNKTNTPARNLLGLVYFEMGETVSALSEWVISKNFQKEKNIADDYINMIQSNPARLEDINLTIKKFNQSLLYCQQGSLDMAQIQLRKVVALNPKLIQARQLLALLFIQSEEWTKAKRELEICKKIDIGNVTTNRYLKEVDEMLGFEAEKSVGKKKNTEAAIRIMSGNETIIQPNNPREPVAWNIIVNILIGFVIGIAVGWFLIAPIRINNAKAGIDEELINVREQLSVKTASVEELTQRVQQLMSDNESMQEELDTYNGTTGITEANKNLMLALAEYNKGNAMDKQVVADYLELIDDSFLQNSATEEFMNLYNMMKETVGPSVAANYYTSGYEAYSNEDYPTAIRLLTKAVSYDPMHGEALYALGNSYYMSKEYEDARAIYVKVIELFPGTEKATKAQNYISKIDAEDVP